MTIQFGLRAIYRNMSAAKFTIAFCVFVAHAGVASVPDGLSLRWLRAARACGQVTEPKPADHRVSGELTGRFLVHGKLAPPIVFGPIMPRTGKRITDDSLSVSGEQQALANVIVYLARGADGGRPPAIADEKPNSDPVIISIFDGHLVPRVVGLRDTQALVIDNFDDDSCFFSFNPTEIGPRVRVDSMSRAVVRVTKARRYPGEIECNAHDWLRGFVYVSDDPYFAVSDDDGRFTIKNVPVGQWVFAAWHERASKLDDVSIDSKPAKWNHGRFTLTIRPGVNSLGTVEIPAETFAR
ncbi:MAG TPA: hypothetical protein VGY55_04055 [Pirellulales bacterium]|nr:hypothetical protein [Pirellulales bacterium]